MFRPDGVLRGRYELTLPTLASGTFVSQPKPQIKNPARVIVTVFRRMHLTEEGSDVVHDASWPLPLAAGKAEPLRVSPRASSSAVR